MPQAGTSAMQQAKMFLSVLADAGRRADEAVREGHVGYDPQTCWAQRNLFELRFRCELLSQIPELADDFDRARQQLQLAIAEYHEYQALTSGLDASVSAA